MPDMSQEEIDALAAELAKASPDAAAAAEAKAEQLRQAEPPKPAERVFKPGTGYGENSYSAE